MTNRDNGSSARERSARGRGVLAAACIAAALLASPAPAQRFAAESATLENGMQVVVVPNHRIPAVVQMVWYEVGAADDPRGKSGIAHFLEHLMFKGTATVPPGGFAASIARSGGRDDAFTTQDYTAFHETVGRERLDFVIRLEADRMTGLVLDDEVVLPERDVVIEERRTRVDTEPASLLGEQLCAALYLHHPYGNPTIGWLNEIRLLGTADALASYRRWYVPNNAILVIGGDVDLPEARALAERHFGPARPGACRRVHGSRNHRITPPSGSK